MVFKTFLRHPSTVSTHPIQLIRSLEETLRPEEGQKAAAAFKAIAGK